MIISRRFLIVSSFAALIPSMALADPITAEFNQADASYLPLDENHYRLTEMINRLAQQTKAERVVVSPVALTIIQSGKGRGAQFERSPFESLSNLAGHIGSVSVMVSNHLRDNEPAKLYVGDQVVAQVNIKGSTVSFFL